MLIIIYHSQAALISFENGHDIQKKKILEMICARGESLHLVKETSHTSRLNASGAAQFN